ncbi:hypothetical protein [Mycobacteroides abscessus]|uniref:hypothetical protein n=1 Tax=Mycobacteroides abscessus TaxID=36809 RepID=UPI0011B288B6|nr:hypothetical protein [Mycobacteroides abscessus]
MKKSQKTPVKHRGVAPEGRYMKMGIDMIREWSHSPEALQVYMLLLSHQGDGSFSESVNSVAKRYGWTWRRANNAVSDLEAARLAVVSGGCWYVSVGEPFPESEWLRLTGCAETAEPSSVEMTQGVVSKQQNLVVSKQQNIEEQEEEQLENQVEDSRYVSNACARDTYELIHAFAQSKTATLQTVPDYGEDAWSDYGDHYQ